MRRAGPGGEGRGFGQVGGVEARGGGQWGVQAPDLALHPSFRHSLSREAPVGPALPRPGRTCGRSYGESDSKSCPSPCDLEQAVLLPVSTFPFCKMGTIIRTALIHPERMANSGVAVPRGPTSIWGEEGAGSPGPPLRWAGGWSAFQMGALLLP